MTMAKSLIHLQARLQFLSLTLSQAYSQNFAQEEIKVPSNEP